MKRYIYSYRNEVIKTVVAIFFVVIIISLITCTNEKNDFGTISLKALSITGRGFFLFVYLFVKRTR
jgi:hypothetical protein